MRFYFHLHNDLDTLDEEGAELANEQAAKDHALKEARVMAAESVRLGTLNLSHFVAVTDSEGKPRFKVKFGEAVDITTGSQWD
jgi:hypothetical protein